MPSVKAGPLTANKGMCSALSKAHPMQNLPSPAAGYTHKGKTPPSLPGLWTTAAYVEATPEHGWQELS